MKLEDRLGRVMARQHDLSQELFQAQADVSVQRSHLLVRLGEVERRERLLRRHYQEALDEGDPRADLLRELPERERKHAQELKTAMAELDSALERLIERIEAVQGAMSSLHELQPLLTARVVQARSVGLGREVFDTLNDALTYVELALAEADERSTPVVRPASISDDEDGDDDDGRAPVPAVV